MRFASAASFCLVISLGRTTAWVPAAPRGSSVVFLRRSTRAAACRGVPETCRGLNVFATQRDGSSLNRLSMKKEAGTDVDIADRLLSTLPYALPFLDGVDYGRYIYALAPGLGEAVYSVFGSTIALWKGTPLVAFGAFIGLTFLARNQSLPRFVRFNVQQAILLDIGLIICNLFEGAIRAVSPGGTEPFTNFIFLCLATSIAYSIFENAQGKVPNQIPIVSDAAEMQIGPF